MTGVNAPHPFPVRTRVLAAHVPALCLLVAGVLALAGCGGDASEAPSSATSPLSTTTATVSTTTGDPAATGESEQSPVVSQTQAAAEVSTPTAQPHIVDCQLGLGPIVTYWSDGSVTGYSDYCQSVHDKVLAGEVEANTPVCDGVTCRYPSGATMPDPAASHPTGQQPIAPEPALPATVTPGPIAPEPIVTEPIVTTPSPWVQGQLDWQDCKEAGNTDDYCRATLN